MKNTLMFIILLLHCGSLSSQPVVEKSESFPEFGGWTKLIQLQNGNTGLMEVTKKDGVKFTLFNTARKKITSGKLPLTKIGDELAFARVIGVYEIGGDYTAFFVTYTTDKTPLPLLYRIIINGSTGKLKNEELLDDYLVKNSKTLYGKEYLGINVEGFYVEKDPESDHYAIIKVRTNALETANRIEVIHYSPDHQIISKANYNTPSGKYKITNYIDAYVHSNEYVIIGAYGYNTKKTGGEDARYYVAKLNKGSSEFIQKELPFTKFDQVARGEFIHNKPKKSINMSFIIDKTQINQNLHPSSMELDQPFVTDFSKVNEIYKNQMKRKDDFSGMVLGSFADSLGNITYLYQYMLISLGNTGSSMYLGDIALVTMSPDGLEISSAVFPCNIYVVGSYDAFAYNEIHKGIKKQGMYTKDWYFGFNMYSTTKGNYIYFNNKIENLSLPETKTAVRVGGISGTNGVIYIYKDGKITKEFAFTNPENPKEAMFINPGASDYKPSTNSYTTILTDPVTKTSAVVWTTLD